MKKSFLLILAGVFSLALCSCAFQERINQFVSSKTTSAFSMPSESVVVEEEHQHNRDPFWYAVTPTFHRSAEAYYVCTQCYAKELYFQPWDANTMHQTMCYLLEYDPRCGRGSGHSGHEPENSDTVRTYYFDFGTAGSDYQTELASKINQNILSYEHFERNENSSKNNTIYLEYRCGYVVVYFFLFFQDGFLYVRLTTLFATKGFYSILQC